MRPLVIVPLACLALLVSACGNEADDDPVAEPTSAEESAPQATEDPGETASAAPATCVYTPDGTAPAKPVDLPAGEPAATSNTAVLLSTTAGDLNLVLRGGATPCTVHSFITLAEQGYFDQTSCHRLTTDGIWVLQCGDPTATGTGGPGYAFADELTGSETYPAGTLAMANAGPGTNGSQFFLVYKDSLGLPANYTVFGKFDASSIRVLQRIAAKGTSTGTPDGPPAETVEIQSVTVR